jgi:hypothetical protein
LPPGRRLTPSIIAAWNRNKGPIDVFSRFMKNCHARHAKLPPLANIWLRLIMTRVYNAYQSFILSSSVSFLLSDECTGYARFQTHRKTYGSFAKFCSVLAKDLTMLEVTGDSSSDDERTISDNSELENNNDHGALNVSGVSVAYNKRELYFTNREMIAKRMDKSLPHVLFKSDSKPTSCVWCCRKKHDQPAEPKHSRHGRTTKYQCPVCMVSLCRIKRFDGQSCHELFHSSTALVDYCTSEMDAMVHVVPHRNRPPPPTHHAAVHRNRPPHDPTHHAAVDARSNSSESDDEEDESPRRTRSRVTPVVTRRLRRSFRNATRASRRTNRRN